MTHSRKPMTMRGSVLAFSLIILTLLFVSSMAMMNVALVEQRSAFATQKSVLAFQAADSGAERVLKRIYRDNSPTVATVPINGNMSLAGGDATLGWLAGALTATSAATCAVDASGATWVSAANSGTPAYQFRVAFYEAGSATPISCADTAWRDKVVRIRSEGFFRNASRVIEMGIRPREP